MSSTKIRLLMPIPEHDFDTTEVSIPWDRFKREGYEVSFSTPSGRRGFTDPLLLKGVVFGKLGASPKAIETYHRLEQDKDFLNPLRYEDVDMTQYNAIVLPGGHAVGMKTYLESQVLQKKVLEFWKTGNTIGAICHGTVVLARTIDPETKKSVLFGRKLTGLTQRLEKTAYYLTAWRRGKYFRTYPEYVQEEVVKNLQTPSDFIVGGSMRVPHVVKDRNLITARFPLDADEFANQIVKSIQAQNK